jgi:hypothetical protein
MQIEIFIDPQAENYERFRQGLEKKIGSLQGIEYSRGSTKAPERTLSVVHDVVHFVIQHPEILKVLPYVIDLVRTSIERWKVPTEPKKPPAVIVVEGKSLKMPASSGAEKRFLDALDSPKASKTKDNSKPRRPSKTRRKKRS